MTFGVAEYSLDVLLRRFIHLCWLSRLRFAPALIIATLCLRENRWCGTSIASRDQIGSPSAGAALFTRLATCTDGHFLVLETASREARAACNARLTIHTVNPRRVALGKVTAPRKT